MSNTREEATAPANKWFPTDTEGLSHASRPSQVRLSDGDSYDLRITAVRKQIGDSVVRMLAYNGSIPGPTLLVKQGSKVTVTTTNDGDVEATVHWHGLRLENRYDGVPEETQKPISIGDTYTADVHFPDPGLYWYHPHIREDFAQEMGLYGTIIVEPSEPGYWPAVDRELTITLDDLLIEDGAMAPFLRSGPRYTAMGRFGNVMIINGETDFSADVAVGEVVRFYFVNTANTRLFNVGLTGTRMKLVGGDSGRYEHEVFVDEVLLAPSERMIVDVLFDKEGDVFLEHREPDRTQTIGVFRLAGPAPRLVAKTFSRLRIDPELGEIRKTIDSDVQREPDKVLGFSSSMPLLYGEGSSGASSYVCPMHPEVTSSEAGTCPKCGMKLIPAQEPAAGSYVCPMHPEVTSSEAGTCPKCGMKLIAAQEPAASSYVCPMHPEVTATEAGTCPMCGMKLIAAQEPAASSYVCPMHPEVTATEADTCPKCGMKLIPSTSPVVASPQTHVHGGEESDGLEWEDLMPDINRQTDPSNMIWRLIDRESGGENHAIEWRFTVGDRVKIRLVNEMDGSDHPMHHPFHIHGAGRFLILSRDGRLEPNLVWKDTVLLRAGETIDILLYVTNPGLWMAHCHIAEHTESGMMFSFFVDPKESDADSKVRSSRGDNDER
jgi:FtsP/CotA-like multicopper oxidase with cupredoxin domain